MTLDELKYLVKEAYTRCESYIGDDNIEGLTMVEEGNWRDEGKYSHCSNIYSADDGDHFQIDNSRSGSYHSDYYYSEPEVYQVKPVVKTITKVVWEGV